MRLFVGLRDMIMKTLIKNGRVVTAVDNCVYIFIDAKSQR